MVEVDGVAKIVPPLAGEVVMFEVPSSGAELEFGLMSDLAAVDESVAFVASLLGGNVDGATPDDVAFGSDPTGAGLGVLTAESVLEVAC